MPSAHCTVSAVQTSTRHDQDNVAKHNKATFLPIFLCEMFSRPAYLYFLLQVGLPAKRRSCGYSCRPRCCSSEQLSARAAQEDCAPFPGSCSSALQSAEARW